MRYTFFVMNIFLINGLVLGIGRQPMVSPLAAAIRAEATRIFREQLTCTVEMNRRRISAAAIALCAHCMWPSPYRQVQGRCPNCLHLNRH